MQFLNKFTPDDERGIYLYSSGNGNGKLNVYKNGFKAVELDRDSIYLLDASDDDNYPKNRNITLNGSDGSAEFASGNIVLDSAGEVKVIRGLKNPIF